MIFDNHLLNKKIEEIVKPLETFCIAGESDEASLHETLESIGMKVSEKTEIFYSRRPNIWKSFAQSFQKAIIFKSKVGNSYMSAISEGRVLLKNKIERSYYFSDLRIHRSAGSKLRREYKSIYSTMVSEIKNFSYTVVFNDNKIAMKALTSRRNPVKYNKLTEYIARTFLALPSPGFSCFKIVPVDDSNIGQYEDFNRKFQFSLEHENYSKNHFLIMKNSLVVGSFSTFQPEYRSLLVRSDSGWINLILRLSKSLSRKENSRLSWRYISHLRVNPAAHNLEFLPNFIKALRKSRAVRLGELVVMLYSPKFEYHFDKTFVAFSPQVVSRATLFQVETELKDRQLESDALLDPNQL